MGAGILTRLKQAHEKRKKAADKQARIKLAKARTELAKKKVREQQKLEKARAEREYYEAKLAVKQEQERAAQTRQASGQYTFSEKTAKIGKSLGKSFGDAGKALMKSAEPGKSGRGRRKAVRSRPAPRGRRKGDFWKTDDLIRT